MSNVTEGVVARPLGIRNTTEKSTGMTVLTKLDTGQPVQKNTC